MERSIRLAVLAINKVKLTIVILSLIGIFIVWFQFRLLIQGFKSSSQYRGSFDPFADRQTSFSESPVTTVSDSERPERAMSRFDFARKPQLPSRSGSTHNQILIESLRNSPQ